MSAATKRKGEKTIEGFDEVKLAELAEPIRVTVHKNKNGYPMPIILPPKPGEANPGQGFTLDEVRQLNEFLPNEWSGGGRYVCKAVGDNGVEMTWQAFFPVEQYPEQIPPTMREAASPAALAASGHSTVIPLNASQLPPMPQAPSFTPWMNQAAASYPQVSHMNQSPVPPYPQNGYPGMPYSAAGFGGTYQSPETEIRKEREERLKLEAKIERERLENTYKERQAAMEQEMRSLRETLQGAASKPVESAELTAMRAEVERLRQQREQDQAEARQAATAAQFQAQILAIQQDAARRASEQDHKLETLMAALTARQPGPDPTMVMFLEMQKTQASAQADAMKTQAAAQIEVARLQAEAQREAARNAIGPREIVDLLKSGANDPEKSLNMMGRTWELLTNAIETMAQANGGGAPSPAVQMLSEGLQGVMGLGQQYLQMKGQSQTTQARAAVAIETARANAIAQVQAGQLTGQPTVS